MRTTSRGQVFDLIAKTKREVLVHTSIFETMLGPDETTGPEEPRAIGGPSLGRILA
jgi:hypothetical protein